MSRREKGVYYLARTIGRPGELLHRVENEQALPQLSCLRTAPSGPTAAAGRHRLMQRLPSRELGLSRALNVLSERIVQSSGALGTVYALLSCRIVFFEWVSGGELWVSLSGMRGYR